MYVLFGLSFLIICATNVMFRTPIELYDNWLSVRYEGHSVTIKVVEVKSQKHVGGPPATLKGNVVG